MSADRARADAIVRADVSAALDRACAALSRDAMSLADAREVRAALALALESAEDLVRVRSGRRPTTKAARWW